MAGIIHPISRIRLTRRGLLAGSAGVAAGMAGWPLAAARQATPAGSDLDLPEGGPRQLATLLQLVPASFAEAAALNGVLFYYADVRRQLEAAGVNAYQPGSEDLPDGYIEATQVLALAAQAYQYAMTPDFVQTFGFSALQAEEALVVGAPPHDLTIFRGGLDAGTLTAAWQASGYAKEPGDGGIDLWTAGKEGEIDLTSRVGRFGLGGLNNAAIVDDDTVVFGRYFDDVASVVRQVADPAGSIIGHASLDRLLPTLTAETVSVIGTTGEFLNVWSMVLPERAGEIDALFAASAEATGGPFPQVDAMLFALTAGAVGPAFTPTGQGTPDIREASPAAMAGGDASVEVRLAVASPEAAATAARAVAYRWEHWDTQFSQRPYTDLMTILAAAPDAHDNAVAAIDYRQVISGRVWIDIILQRDLLPFAWEGEQPSPATPKAVG